jgi:hypothetical protein
MKEQLSIGFKLVLNSFLSISQSIEGLTGTRHEQKSEGMEDLIFMKLLGQATCG